MGIFCEIGVAEPNNEFTPGGVVSGTIKYAFDKNTAVKRIVISLKGSGRFCITRYSKDDDDRMNSSTLEESEEYVSIENVIFNDDTGKSYQNGVYFATFKYLLPENIPGSLKYHYKHFDDEIKCKIAYFIGIEFEVAGSFKFDKKFDKEVKVVPVLKPKLPIKPIVYGERKQLFQPFKVKKGIINVKTCIKCSVLEPGGKAKIACEVLNDSNKIVEAIETKIVTIYKFYTKNYLYKKMSEDLEDTQCKTSAIKCGETSELPLEIEIPLDLYCIEDSKIVSREYAVAIIVHLPAPHINMRLEIPIQVGKTSVIYPIANIDGSAVEHDSPPSYWEVMNVGKEKDTSFGDGFLDDVKK